MIDNSLIALSRSATVFTTLLPSSTCFLFPLSLPGTMDRLDGHEKTSGQDEQLEFVALKLSGLADTSDGMEKGNGGEYCSRAEKSRISRKLGVRIILPLGLMLAASMFDRANIGNAAIAG